MTTHTSWLKSKLSPFHFCCTPWHNRAKPRGPVTQKHQSVEVATPTCKRGFVMPKFLGLVCSRASPLMVTGRGGAYPQGLPHGYGRVFDHHAPPYVLKNANGGFLHPVGAKTMTAITTASSASTPAQGTSDPIQLHAEAHNALNMAVFYLRQPTANVPGARRKAIRALCALRRLSLSLED